MQKAILTILGTAVIALSAVQLAAASEHQGKAHHRAPAAAQFRNSNAYVAPPVVVQPDGYGYYSHGFSAPAGH